MLAALCTSFFFALTAVFANRAAHRLGSARANFWRLLLATGVLTIWAHGFGRGIESPARTWFFISGLAGFGVGGFAMFQSLPRLGSSLSMLIVQCGSAVFAASIEWGWLGTTLSGPQILAATVTLTGVAIGLLPRSLPAASVAERLTGIGWAVLSAAGQGLGAVLSRKAFATAASAGELVDAGTASYQRALAGLLVAALAFAWFHWRHPEKPRESGRGWPWVLANVTTGPVLGVVCFQWALSTTPAGIVQPIVATSPLLTIPIAARIEHLHPRLTYYIGATLAVAGVAGLLAWR